MKIVCLGSDSAQDTIAATQARYNLTSSTSQKMVDYFNSQGGNTPLKSTTVATKDEPGFFDKAWGIFQKLGTLATPEQKPAYVVKPAAPPLAAIVGIGLVGLILLKAAK